MRCNHQAHLKCGMIQVDSVLCGEEEMCKSSSSSSSSEDEDMLETRQPQASTMQGCSDLKSSSSNNVIPMDTTLKIHRAAPPREDILEILSSLPSGARVKVCQGKACSKRGSAHLLMDLQALPQNRVELMPCKCLDKCKTAPNVMVIVDKEVKVVSVNAPAPKPQVLVQ